jgi:hypothetical protein
MGGEDHRLHEPDASREPRRADVRRGISAPAPEGERAEEEDRPRRRGPGEDAERREPGRRRGEQAPSACEAS